MAAGGRAVDRWDRGAVGVSGRARGQSPGLFCVPGRFRFLFARAAPVSKGNGCRGCARMGRHHGRVRDLSLVVAESDRDSVCGPRLRRGDVCLSGGGPRPALPARAARVGSLGRVGDSPGDGLPCQGADVSAWVGLPFACRGSAAAEDYAAELAVTRGPGAGSVFAGRERARRRSIRDEGAVDTWRQRVAELSVARESGARAALSGRAAGDRHAAASYPSDLRRSRGL